MVCRGVQLPDVPVRTVVCLPVHTGLPYDAVTASHSPSDHVSGTRATGTRDVVMRVFAQTDVGRSRQHNEDTFLVANLETGAHLTFTDQPAELTAAGHGVLFLVADGMGGAASGELASSMAATLVLDALTTSWQGASPSPQVFAEALRDATLLANARIHQHAQEYPEHRGMGTTVTIAGLLGDRLFLVQVGDSRAYMVRDGHVQQLTKDQSLMQRLVEAGEITAEQAEVSERRNIILQALGPESQVTIDLTHQQLRRGDTLILCSDGLSGVVRASEIVRITQSEQDVRAICSRLIDRANVLGGPDNITVIAARFDGSALHATATGDTFGYNAYPLVNTLNAQPPEAAPPPAPTQSAEQAVVLGAPAPVIADRRRAVQPVLLALGLVAGIAAIWLLVALFS